MEDNSEVVYLYLDDIIPNRFQPREVFNEQALKELAVSIKEHGVIQPIIVRKVENKYEIIAGERRYKASTMAGLTKIPAIVKNLDDKESSKVALIENLQRKDLSPIEEARTYQKILELEDSMTQEQLAATMGKTQSSVSNKLRLLALPDEIQDALLKEKISERHARSLLNIEDKNEQIKMLDRIIADKMTVRELDKVIKEIHGETEKNDNIGVNNFTNSDNSEIAPVPTTPIEELDSDSNNTIEVKEELSENNMNNDNTNNLNTISQDINPTSVDINQIRENSQDIISTTPPKTVENLMTNENSDTSFKFVPSFGINQENNGSTTSSTDSSLNNSNLFGGAFNPNLDVNINQEQVNKENEDNNSIASSISVSPLTIPSISQNFSISQSSPDVTKAVSDIKNTIASLQNNGYKINVNDEDGSTNYKITIEIEK